MKYLDLFQEIQLSRDYYEDPKTGVNWRYQIDNEAKRVYVQFQETKTKKDWFYNFLVIPKKVENTQKKTIIVPLGFYLQANAAVSYILRDVWGCRKGLDTTYDWYFTGWSLGGAAAGIAGFILGDMLHLKRHIIMYGTPSYNLTKKSLQTLCDNFSTVKNFLYRDDWIKSLVPFYKRSETIDVEPDQATETLDARHRVYGHCTYAEPEF